MKTTFLVALLAALPMGFAQSLAPSPTESIGCEPHGDHWHCDGPRETGASSSNHHNDDHDHDHDDDHDHDHDDDEHSHSHAAGTASLAPSPTESIGCEPHGDHWHCDGPRTTGVAGAAGTPGTPTGTPTANPNQSTTSTEQPGAAATHALPMAGLIAAAVLAL